MIHFIPQVLSPQGLPLEAVNNEMHPHKYPTQISTPLQIDHQENPLIIRSHLEKLQEEKGKCQKQCGLLQMHPNICIFTFYFEQSQKISKTIPLIR